MAASQLMARSRIPPMSRRWLEWALLACVVAALMTMLGQKIRQVQGQGEGAAIRSTLGALRVALVLNHLQASVASVPGQTATGQRNPFEMLASRPFNYGGERQGGAGATLSPGRWVFDLDCSCVGYMPLNPQWLDSPSGSEVIWLRLRTVAGVAQLQVNEAYRWQGERLD